jgi:aminoglycoside phosphotransferase (APT) family kinase protein
MSFAATRKPLPIDPRLPTLEKVLNASVLRRALGEVLPWNWGKVETVDIEVLQYHRASRCTMNVRVQTAGGLRELIGKVYATDRRDVFRIMNQISNSGFGPEAEFSIPKPIAYIPDLHLLILEKIEGRLAGDIFAEQGPESDIVAESCARWLARFHANGPRLGPVFVPSREILETWVKRLAKRAELVVPKAEWLFRRLEANRPGSNGEQMCASHGTYCHYQIIISEGRTVTLDWDGHCVADPALDVARFLVILQQLSLDTMGSPTALNGLGVRFYETYQRESGFAVSSRLPFFKAALCLKHAKDFAKRDDVRPHLAESMIDEGLRILEEEL